MFIGLDPRQLVTLIVLVKLTCYCSHIYKTGTLSIYFTEFL